MIYITEAEKLANLFTLKNKTIGKLLSLQITDFSNKVRKNFIWMQNGGGQTYLIKTNIIKYLIKYDPVKYHRI